MPPTDPSSQDDAPAPVPTDSRRQAPRNPQSGDPQGSAPIPRNLAKRLPGHLTERLRVAKPRDGWPEDGELVLYWMHHAVRGHENPALDTAILAARTLRLPLLVYQGLGGHHPFDNDRHHTFILEGARDAAAELAGRGVRHVFHLGDGSDGPPPLHALARRAALVVTEDFPAPPLPRWTAALAAAVPAPVWLVDTACVVPMRLAAQRTDGSADRAYEFRRAIRKALDERLGRPWPEVTDDLPAPFRGDLPFEPLDLAHANLAELVARCEIDHTVGPVAETPGGSVAGYRRWDAFREDGLAAYASRRNDPTRDGASAMSPYLHHGHVSPLRIARQAAAALDAGTAQGATKGAKKYLDELIVWRELAHNLCFHRHDEVESLAVLPDWARQTLAEHADDERQVLPWETLARGRTGDRLWDLCQASLVRHGWLHNNVRMTWGKAIPHWTADPAAALACMIDLNHRFALDGSDPNSYGGILWCLGKFDRPFKPKAGQGESPVLGQVRGRSSAAHARRLDLDRYAARVLAPATARPLEVAVVGAGVAGLICARTLADHGHRVRVFDKARGPGGRTSTRRATVAGLAEAGEAEGTSETEVTFDHGAQYFTARDPRFQRWVESWIEAGLVAEWRGTIAEIRDGQARAKTDQPRRYVGVPRMSALCRHLAEDLEVAYTHRVAGLVRDGDRWRLAFDASDRESPTERRYDAVVVSAPGPQTAALLEGVAPALAQRAAATAMAPCWSVMAAWNEPLAETAHGKFEGAFVHGSPLSWVARNASKPERGGAETWVLHASEDWSRDHLEDSPEAVAEALWEAFRDLLTDVESRPEQPVHLTAHRWRYARPAEPDSERCLFDASLGLAACGDGFGGPRVEGAFLSGSAAAGRLLALRPGAAQPGLFD